MLLAELAVGLVFLASATALAGLTWSAWDDCRGDCGRQGNRTRQLLNCKFYQCYPSQFIGVETCSVPCQNGGTSTGHGCLCTTGYTGLCCETAVEDEVVACQGYCQAEGTSACHTSGGQPSCVCKPGWQGTLCDTVSTCPEPADPAHGEIEGSDYQYGSHIEYVCDMGYALAEGDATRVCQGAGPSWSGTPPICQRNQYITAPDFEI